MAYPLGTGVTFQATFQDELDIPTDPTTVILYVKPPKHVTSTQYTGGQLTKISTGVYEYNLYLDTPGTWYYCWEGTGTVEAATFDIPVEVTKSKLRST